MTIKALWELRDSYMKDCLAKRGLETCEEATRYAESALSENHPEEYARWLKMRDFPALDLPIYVRILQHFGMFIYPRPANIDNIFEAYQATRLASYGFDMPSHVKSKARLFTWQELLLNHQCCMLPALGFSGSELKRSLC